MKEDEADALRSHVHSVARRLGLWPCGPSSLARMREDLAELGKPSRPREDAVELSEGGCYQKRKVGA